MAGFGRSFDDWKSSPDGDSLPQRAKPYQERPVNQCRTCRTTTGRGFVQTGAGTLCQDCWEREQATQAQRRSA